MAAYVIVTETVHDQATFDAYRKQVMATLAPFDAKFLVRGGKVTIHEGKWPHAITIVIEFPSRAQAEGWYNSPAYQKIIDLRLKSSTGDFVIADGV
jgi:uncharacterized protein (DUF1330 family)